MVSVTTAIKELIILIHFNYFHGYWETTKIFLSNISNNKIFPDKNFHCRYMLTSYIATVNMSFVLSQFFILAVTTTLSIHPHIFHIFAGLKLMHCLVFANQVTYNTINNESYAGESFCSFLQNMKVFPQILEKPFWVPIYVQKVVFVLIKSKTMKVSRTL